MSRITRPSIACLGLALIALAGTASHAQWSRDAASPLIVAGNAGDQAISKVARTSDGGCYIAWFENAGGAGYDVRLQRLDALGVPQWAADGILVIDCNFSSTQDYDLEVDAAGNAVIASRDNLAFAGATRIVVNKIDPSGNKLWGPIGTAVSTGTSNVSNPKLAILSDGDVGVAFSQDNAVVLARLDGEGTIETSRTIAEPSRPMTAADACAGNDGSFIVMWVRASGSSFAATRWLYAQRYDANLNELWPSTVAAGASAVGVFVNTINAAGSSVAGSLQIAYFPTIRSDGNGGMVAGWYENGSKRQAYMQHVLADGSLKFPFPGLSSDTSSTRITVGMGFDYDIASGHYLLGWSESNASPQGVYAMRAQRFDAAGSAMWPGGVSVVEPGGATQVSFVNPLLGPSGAFVFGFAWSDPSGSLNATVRGARFDMDGSTIWNRDVNSLSAGKSRMNSTFSASGKPLLVYGVGPAGNADIAAQRIMPDGAIGYCTADLGSAGGASEPDDVLDNNDFIVFINLFFSEDPRVDLGSEGGAQQPDGIFDNNDFIVYIGSFFQGCP